MCFKITVELHLKYLIRRVILKVLNTASLKVVEHGQTMYVSKKSRMGLYLLSF